MYVCFHKLRALKYFEQTPLVSYYMKMTRFPILAIYSQYRLVMKV